LFRLKNIQNWLKSCHVKFFVTLLLSDVRMAALVFKVGVISLLKGRHVKTETKPLAKRNH
jgi:hypothetical protein